MTSVCTVSEKGQVTLPKQLRDQLGIVPGTRLQFAVEADGRLDGQWTMGGADGGVFSETLTKLKIGAEPKLPRPTRRPAPTRWGVNI